MGYSLYPKIDDSMGQSNRLVDFEVPNIFRPILFAQVAHSKHPADYGDDRRGS